MTPELNLGVIFFSTATADATKILALSASSTPPLTINAATGFTGASSIHRLDRLVTDLVRATSSISPSSSDFGLPKILANALTLGS